MRLRQAFPEHNNKPFSEQLIILFRDFSQLSLVLDFPIYARIKKNVLSNDDFTAYYKQFWEV
jgi:hypothetical protein